MVLALQACMKRKYADLVVHNAVIHVLDETNSKAEAMAIKDGKVLEVGPERQILNKYRWGRSIDAEKRHIYPGFIDTYGHHLEAMLNGFSKDEWNYNSFEEAMQPLQQQLFRMGVVEIHEAGISNTLLEWLMAYNKKRKLDVRCYTMLEANMANYLFAKKIGIYHKGNLSVRSFHILQDEKHPLVQDSMLTWGQRCQELHYQLVYYPATVPKNDGFWMAVKNAYATYPDHRWRLVLSEELDAISYENLKKYATFPLVLFGDVEKISDPIGNNSHKPQGITFHALKDAFGMFALGTNNPTFSQNILEFISQFADQDKLAMQYVSSKWKDLKLEELLKSMTQWAAFSSFSESNRGALREGKEANFFIAKHALTSGNKDNYALQTYIQGMKVYDSKEEF